MKGSLLELVKKANKEADDLLLLDQQRLENIQVPELKVPEEQIFKWFEQVKNKVQERALKGAKKAEVYLYDVDERHAGKAALEAASLKDISEWIENCISEYNILQKGDWYFNPNINKEEATKRFNELQMRVLDNFVLHLLKLWNEFDSSLLPKFEKRDSNLMCSLDLKWRYRDAYDRFRSIFQLPCFKLTFNWEEEAKEPPSKKLKE